MSTFELKFELKYFAKLYYNYNFYELIEYIIY